MIKRLLEPSWEPDLTIHEIPLGILIEKEIQALILDVDGTIINGNKVTVHNPVKEWIDKASKHFYIHLFSNNPSASRISTVANLLKLNYTYKAGKPSRKKLKKVITKIGKSHNKIAIIGDRIFTDVLAGNRLGLYTILIRPIGKDGGQSKSRNMQKLEKAISRLFGAELK